MIEVRCIHRVGADWNEHESKADDEGQSECTPARGCGACGHCLATIHVPCTKAPVHLAGGGETQLLGGRGGLIRRIHGGNRRDKAEIFNRVLCACWQACQRNTATRFDHAFVLFLRCGLHRGIERRTASRFHERDDRGDHAERAGCVDANADLAGCIELMEREVSKHA